MTSWRRSLCLKDIFHFKKDIFLPRRSVEPFEIFRSVQRRKKISIMKFFGVLIVAFALISLGISVKDFPSAHAGDQYMDSDYRRDEIAARREEVRALERIAGQLDKINDSIKDCRR